MGDNWMVTSGKWVCEQCYNVMEVIILEENYNEITCRFCGNTYYVDDDGEQIN